MYIVNFAIISQKKLGQGVTVTVQCGSVGGGGEERVCERDTVRVREIQRVCVREREIQRYRGCVRERDRVCVRERYTEGVCVREREVSNCSRKLFF